MNWLSFILNRYTLASALLVGLYWFGHSQGYDTGFAVEKKVYDEHIAADRAADDAARIVAHLREAQLALAAGEASKSYEQGKANAEFNAEKTAADLRAGNLRLRGLWSGCQAARAADAAAATGQFDAAAEDRAASAGRIVRAAAECEAQVLGLQQILISEREGQGKKP